MRTVCAHCGELFEASRRTARYCSAACRSRARRRAAHELAAAAVDEPPALVTGVTDSVTRHLERHELLDKPEAQQALTLARRMDSPGESGSAIAALSRELSRVMGLMVHQEVEDDPVARARRKFKQMQQQHLHLVPEETP